MSSILGPDPNTVAYALHYFGVAGRGELIRLLFTAAGQKFTDDRIEFANWPALKAGTPWSALPYLEVDGKVLGQTKAIIRYVAHQHGLGGSDPFQQGLVDSVVEATRDILDDLFVYQYGDASGKEKALTKLTDTTIPTILGNLEKFIGQNGKHGFTVGGKLTTADLAVFDVIQQLKADPEQKLTTATTEYAKVNEVAAKVLADPKVAAYVSKSA